MLPVPFGEVTNPYPSHQPVRDLLDVLDKQNMSVSDHCDVVRDVDGLLDDESEASEPDDDMDVLPTAIGAHIAETEAVGVDERELAVEDTSADGEEKITVRDTVHEGVKKIMRAAQRPGTCLCINV